MLHHIIEVSISIIVPIGEIIGILVLAISLAVAAVRYAKSLITRQHCDIKLPLAHGMEQSLQFLMAAEILKTVLVHDLQEIFILGGIVVLRGLLSLLIYFETRQIEPSHNSKSHHKTEVF